MSLAPAPRVPRIVSAPEIQWDPRRPPTYDAAARRATVFNHADVLRVLRTDGATMTQQYGPTADREDEHPNRSFMWAWDGKAHDDRRRLLEEPFTRALRGIVPAIQARTNARIDEILRSGTGTFDVMATLALVPYDIISVLIGAPLGDTALFLEWLEEANSSSIDGMPRQDRMRDYFLGLIERARTDRRDGLLDHLLRAQADGVTLDGRPIRDRDILASLWGDVLRRDRHDREFIRQSLLDGRRRSRTPRRAPSGTGSGRLCRGGGAPPRSSVPSGDARDPSTGPFR